MAAVFLAECRCFVVPRWFEAQRIIFAVIILLFPKNEKKILRRSVSYLRQLNAGQAYTVCWHGFDSCRENDVVAWIVSGTAAFDPFIIFVSIMLANT